MSDQGNPSSPPDSPDQTGKPTLRSLAMRGTIITVGGNGASAFLRLASSLVVTRLLDPNIYGVMGVVVAFLYGLNMFSDLGVSRAIIQHERGDEPEFLNTAWSFLILRGLLICLACCAIGWPAAAYYGWPDLSWCLPLAGLSFLIFSFSSTKMYRAQRNLALGRLQIIRLSAQFISIIVMIVVAYYTRSILALVLGRIVSCSIEMVLSHRILPGERSRLAWDATAMRDLWSFGKWVFAGSVLTFFAFQADKLVLGKLVEEELLGFYVLAGMLASMPGEFIQQLWFRVLYPAVARKMREGTATPAWASGIRSSLLLIVGAPMAAGIALAEPLVAIAYDERYVEVGALLQILLLSSWLGALVASYESFLLSKGEPKYKTYGVALKTVTFMALVWPTFQNFGIRGVAGLVCLSQFVLLIPLLAGAVKLGYASLLLDAAFTIAMGVLAYAFLVAYGLLLNFTGSSILATAIVLMVAFLIAAVNVRRRVFTKSAS